MSNTYWSEKSKLEAEIKRRNIRAAEFYENAKNSMKTGRPCFWIVRGKY